MPQRTERSIVNDLVDPISIISNANEILYEKLGAFVDEDTRACFEMIRRATAKSKSLVEDLKRQSYARVRKSDSCEPAAK